MYLLMYLRHYEKLNFLLLDIIKCHLIKILKTIFYAIYKTDASVAQW